MFRTFVNCFFEFNSLSFTAAVIMTLQMDSVWEPLRAGCVCHKIYTKTEKYTVQEVRFIKKTILD